MIEYERLMKQRKEMNQKGVLKRNQELDELINDLKADSEDEVIDKIQGFENDLGSEISDLQHLSS